MLLIAQQWGLNAVGIPGVSNFPDQYVHVLNQYDIYIVMDSDVAGKAAAGKLAKKFSTDIHIIELEADKDLTDIYDPSIDFFKSKNISIKKDIKKKSRFYSARELRNRNLKERRPMITNDLITVGYTLISGGWKIWEDHANVSVCYIPLSGLQVCITLP